MTFAEMLQPFAVFLGVGCAVFGLSYGAASLLRIFKTFASDNDS